MKKYKTEFELEVVQSFLAGDGGARAMGGRKSGGDQRHSKNGDSTALTAHRTGSGPDIQDMHGDAIESALTAFKIFFLI